MKINNYSIVIPAKDEAAGLKQLLPKLKPLDASEIIIVDDGSTDETKKICSQYKVKCVSHPYPKGNGAAIKTGAKAAESDIIVFMDADGQHKPEDIKRLLERMSEGFDMVVGARQTGSQASFARDMGNKFYNKFASGIVGHKIEDLTSGFRVVKKELFMKFLYLLPNGFSYPTTITMAFFRAGYSLSYVPIHMPRRIGKSHLKIWKDGIKFLLIMFRVGTLYSPLKIFFPLALLHFLVGLFYYAYTFITMARFTNMSALLFTTAMIIFLIGLVSEQITNLIYKDST